MKSLAGPAWRRRVMDISRPEPFSGAKYAVMSALYILAYVVLDQVSFIYAWSAFSFTLWNPPPALSLALIVTRGPAYAPLIFPAALLSDYVVRGAPLGLAVSLASASILTLGYGGLGLVLRRLGSLELSAGRLRELMLILAAVPAAIGVIAVTYVGTFVTIGLIPASDFLISARAFWVGDVTGVVALLPVLLLLHAPADQWRSVLRGGAFDFLVFTAGLTLALWLIFAADFTNELSYFYLIFIPMIWIAIRRGIAGAVIGVLIIQASVVAEVLVEEYRSESFLTFQMFLLILGITGLLLGSVVSARAAAELRVRRQQAEMDRAARMTTVGVMASALAHEISQPLASIASHAHAAQLRLAAGQDAAGRVKETLSQIVGETDRAGAILRSLRNFMAHGECNRTPIRVAPLLQKAVELLRREPLTLPVQLVLHVERDPLVTADAMQIEQVILNIISNGIEATAQNPPGGIVRISLRESAHGAEIVVDDEGRGVDPQIAPHMFEPFMTTKENGMGLGLAICQSLIELNGGRINYSNRPEGGARFQIEIPRALTSRGLS